MVIDSLGDADQVTTPLFLSFPISKKGTIILILPTSQGIVKVSYSLKTFKNENLYGRAKYYYGYPPGKQLIFLKKFAHPTLCLGFSKVDAVTAPVEVSDSWHQ